MKTLLVAALGLAPVWAWADGETNAAGTPSEPMPAPAPISEPVVADPLAGLTPEQKKQGEEILAKEAKRKKAIEEDKKLSPTEKQAQLSIAHRNALIEIQTLRMSAPPVKH